MWKMIRKDLILASIFKIMERVLLVCLPFLMGFFLKEINKPASSNQKLVGYIFIIILFNFFARLFGEHGNYTSATCTAKVGQMLRSLMYTKLKRCNKSFLEIADPSLISKVLFFEIEIILNFISQVSEKVASPVILIVSSFLVYTKLGWAAFVILVIVILFLFLQYCLVYL